MHHSDIYLVKLLARAAWKIVCACWADAVMVAASMSDGTILTIVTNLSIIVAAADSYGFGGDSEREIPARKWSRPRSKALSVERRVKV